MRGNRVALAVKTVDDSCEVTRTIRVLGCRPAACEVKSKYKAEDLEEQSRFAGAGRIHKEAGGSGFR